jgi:hypothetical protein
MHTLFINLGDRFIDPSPREANESTNRHVDLPPTSCEATSDHLAFLQFESVNHFAIVLRHFC